MPLVLPVSTLWALSWNKQTHPILSGMARASPVKSTGHIQIMENTSCSVFGPTVSQSEFLDTFP